MDVLNSFVKNLLNNITNKFTQEDYEMAKIVLMDYLAVTSCGFNHNKKKHIQLINHFSISNKGYTLIGYNKKTDILSALLINGISSHTLELDDGERYGQVHLGAPIITALLSVIENKYVSGMKFLESIIISYESGIRLSRAFQPNHTQNGFHATATFGSAAASIGVSYLLDYDVEKMTNSLKNALIGGAGFLKVIDGDSDIKPLNVANASIRGVISAFITESGFKPPENIFDGSYGYEKVVSSIQNSTYLTDFKQEKKYIHSIYLKKYPSCRHTHAAIEATKLIMTNNNIPVEEINKIVINSYNYVIGKHDHKAIVNTNSAKMSIPYSVALQILYDEPTLEMYSQDFINNDEVINIMNKIHVVEKTEYSEMFPKTRASSVDIYMNNKIQYSEEVYFPKGEPENPMNREDIKNKFFSLMKDAEYSNNSIVRIYNVISNLDIINTNEFFELIGDKNNE